MLTAEAKTDFAHTELSGAGVLFGQQPLLLEHLREGAEWLRAAPENIGVRFVWGALYMSPGHGDDFHRVVLGAFAPKEDGSPVYRGWVLSGGSACVLSSNPRVMRPSVSEIGPLLEKSYGFRSLGVFPGERLAEREAGGWLICRDQVGGAGWEIIPDPRQRAALPARRATPYFWNAEPELCLELVREAAPRRMAYICFDGGIGTEHELKLVTGPDAADLRAEVVLVTGGNPRRVTDRFARDARWLAGRVNLHVVEKSAPALRNKLAELGIQG